MSDLTEQLDKARSDLKELENVHRNLIYDIKCVLSKYVSESDQKVQPFGKENIAYLTKEIVDQNFKAGISGDLSLFCEIFLNSKHPENKNIKIMNEDVLTYDGKTWIYNDMYEIVRNFLVILGDLYRALLNEKSKRGDTISPSDVSRYQTIVYRLPEYKAELEEKIINYLKIASKN